MTGDERDNIDKWWMEEQFATELPRCGRIPSAIALIVRHGPMGQIVL